MEEAFVYGIFAILSFFGILKIFELIQNFASIKGREKSVLLCRIKNNAETAEMTVRSLASDLGRLTTFGNTVVFILSDDLDVKTRNICTRTAEQYNNVVVGNIEDLNSYITN